MGGVFFRAVCTGTRPEGHVHRTWPSIIRCMRVMRYGQTHLVYTPSHHHHQASWFKSLHNCGFSRCVPFVHRQVRVARHQGWYGCEGQLCLCSLCWFCWLCCTSRCVPCGWRLGIMSGMDLQVGVFGRGYGGICKAGFAGFAPRAVFPFVVVRP